MTAPASNDSNCFGGAYASPSPQVEEAMLGAVHAGFDMRQIATGAKGRDITLSSGRLAEGVLALLQEAREDKSKEPHAVGYLLELCAAALIGTAAQSITVTACDQEETH